MYMELNLFLVFGGLIIGLLLGIITQRSKFCMAAAVSNLVLMRDYQQLHAYLAALIIAIAGTQLLEITGLVSFTDTTYLASQVNWLGAIIGGTAFGVGAIFSGGCVGRTLIRVGEGNLGSLIVLFVIGITASATMYGVLVPLRLGISQAVPLSLSSETGSISSVSGLPAPLISIAIIVLCLMVIIKSKHEEENRTLLFAGGLIGLLIVLGWWITGFLSQDIFSVHPPASLTFAGPLANASYMVSSGSLLGDGATFGLTLLLGTIFGSTISAILSRSFYWTLPELHHIKHLILGGILMGFGAVVAGGCNIGHGLTGLSTCSINSIIALISIAAGLRLGVYFLMSTETLASNSKPEPSQLSLFINRFIKH